MQHLNENGSVSNTALMAGPSIGLAQDRLTISWAGAVHELTWWHLLQLGMGWTTVDKLACRLWPRRAQARDHLYTQRARTYSDG